LTSRRDGDGGVRLSTTLVYLSGRYGGEIRAESHGPISQDLLGRFVPLDAAGRGDLAPLLSRRFVRAAYEASERGARLLVAAELAARSDVRILPGWFHPHAPWVMAKILEELAVAPESPPAWGADFRVGEHVVLGPRVLLGARVHIGDSSVIGRAGFGWVTGPDGSVTHTPHLGGVVIEDDVYIGSHATIDAGVLAPTVIRRGVKIDAHVHVGHNCEIGEGTMIAAQAGFAGSVTIGRNVLVGGQVGIADHVTVGDGARIGAKSGVIGDVPAGAVVAGYPAVARMRWLRALAGVYRKLD
jgi:UDP-3-O-[3-hydroxymyristoyl] glucosamine N-acyltransferase